MSYRVFKPITSFSTRSWLINPSLSPAHESRAAYSQVSRGDWPWGSAISLGLNSQLAETLGTTVRQPLVISHWHFGCCSDGIVAGYSDWMAISLNRKRKFEVWAAIRSRGAGQIKVWPVWWINAFPSIIFKSLSLGDTFLKGFRLTKSFEQFSQFKPSGRFK